MALDAAFLKQLCAEINEKAAGSRIDKVFQPEKDEIALLLRSYGETLRLRISASSSNPAVYFTAHSKDNPKQAPMLCMLLRKLYTGGRFIRAVQPDFERVLRLDFECGNDMGDRVGRSIIVELMGRNSNVVFTDEGGRITDAVKHIGGDIESRRLLIPGIAYKMPAAQERKSPFDISFDELAAHIAGFDGELADSLLAVLSGVSPLFCREAAFRAVGDIQLRASSLDKAQIGEVWKRLSELTETIKQGAQPVALLRPSDGKLVDFCFFHPYHLGGAVQAEVYGSYSGLLDEFYYSRDRAERMKQRTAALSKLVSRAAERVMRRNCAQERELRETDGAQELRLRGELLTANLYAVKRGADFAEVENFYDGGAIMRIPLDKTLTPQQNAQKYFKAYKKALTRRTHLTEQLIKGADELEWLRSVESEIALAESESDISEIRRELVGEGYIKAQPEKRRSADKPIPFITEKTSDGFTVMCGRNNMQNDRLTMKTASKSDIWFHVRGIPGSHVVLFTEGREATDTAIAEAAELAAKNSRASAGKTAVDYTSVRNVHKPSGAKPGKVIYTQFKTIIVSI